MSQTFSKTYSTIANMQMKNDNKTRCISIGNSYNREDTISQSLNANRTNPTQIGVIMQIELILHK